MNRALISIVLVGMVMTGCRTGNPPVRLASKDVGPPARHTAIRTLDVPYGQVGMAGQGGDSLFVTAGTREGGSIDTILRYQGTSTTPTTVFTGTRDLVSITCNDRWLVWQSGRTLYAQSLATGRRSTLTVSRGLLAPSIDGDTVVWVQFADNRTASIHAADLATDARTTVATLQEPGLYNNFVSLDARRIVWTDIVDGVGHYRVYDRTSHRTADYRLTGTDYRYPGYAVPAGERLYSINFKNAKEWDWTVQQYGYFSLNDKTWVPLSRQGYIDFLEAGPRTLAIVDQAQRLLLRSPDGTGPVEDVSSEIGAPVDWIQRSGESTLVAGRSDVERGRTTLYVMGLR